MNPYYIRYDSSDNNLFLVLGPLVVQKRQGQESKKTASPLLFFIVGYLIIKEEADDRAEYKEL